MANFLVIISIFLTIIVEYAFSYAIRSQGYHISYGSFTNTLQIQAFRFFVSFDLEVTTNDYIEVYFPFSLQSFNASYPFLRIVDYGDTSKYSNQGLEYYNLDEEQFKPCNGIQNNHYYFKSPQILQTKQLYVIEIIPQKYNVLPQVNFHYNYDTISIKITSHNSPQYLTYSCSFNVAAFYLQYLVTKQFTHTNRVSPINYEINIVSTIDSLPEIINYGGYVVVEFQSSDGNTIESCSQTGCVISKDKQYLSIPFTGIQQQNLGSFTLSVGSQFLTNYNLNSYVVSKAPAFLYNHIQTAFVFHQVLGYQINSFSNSDNSLTLKNILYHWRLAKDNNQEIALFVSTASKYVYNKLTIQFTTTKSFTLPNPDPDKQFFRLDLELGSTANILEGSIFISNFVPVSSDALIICKSTGTSIYCRKIKEILINTVYEISFKVIVLSMADNYIHGLKLFYCSPYCSLFQQIDTNALQAQPFSVVQNTDTTSPNSSWSPQLNDLQVISVPDVGTNTADVIAKKGYYSSTTSGGGIFISRGVESLIFYLTINPANLCNGNCSDGKLINMSMTANNNFLKFTGSNTSGLQLAAQDAATSTFKFTSLDCTQGTVGCFDGQSTEVLYPATTVVMNGKSVDTSTQTVKYTLRCGQVGVVNPTVMSSCSKMFQGKETVSNTYQNGYGGFFYIKQVDISNGFIPSRVVADDQSPDFLLTFYIEDPITLSKTVTLRTIINAYTLSYHSSDGVSFMASLVNMSKNSQGLNNPSLLRIRVTSPKDNKKLIVFFDNSIELSSFIDRNENRYSCQVITQSNTIAHFDSTKCLAFVGSQNLLNSNYNFNNILMVNLDVTGVSFLEVLIPVSASSANLNPTYLHVGYGTIAGDFFQGLQYFSIQELVSVKGIPTTGSLQTDITPYLTLQSTQNEDLTGLQKMYTYPGSAATITFKASINIATTKMTLTDSTHTIVYNDIKRLGSTFGAGILLTSIEKDPFQDQVELSPKSGVFPNQTGKCFKLTYFVSDKLITPTPQGLFNSKLRYSVFCPFDDNSPTTLTIASISSIKSQPSDPDVSQFILAQSLADNSIMSLAVSEREGRNVAQQKISYDNPSNLITCGVSVTSPPSSFNIDTLYNFNMTFVIDNFHFSQFFNYTIIVEIQDNFIFTNFNFLTVEVTFGEVVVPSIFSQIGGIFKVEMDPSLSSEAGAQISDININCQVGRSTLANVLSTTALFKFNIYYKLPYYQNSQEYLYLNNQLYTLSKAFTVSPRSSFTVNIDRPVFERKVKGARDTMQFSFQISIDDTEKTEYNPLESFEIIPGFLVQNQNDQPQCLFYSDPSYKIINHSVKTFSQFKFSFKESFNYNTKIYIQCSGLTLLDSANNNAYSVKYYNSQGLDMISLVIRYDELIKNTWNLSQKTEQFFIQSVDIEYTEPGINSLKFQITQMAMYPVSYQNEYIVYFPFEIDLNEHMHTCNLQSTVIYVPEKHALRIKISSMEAFNPMFTINIFPVYITKQLLSNIFPSFNFYIDYYDQESKSITDQAQIQIGSQARFTQIVERSLITMNIDSATLKYGTQSSIDTLTIVFGMSTTLSAIVDRRVIIYSRIGSQINQTPLANLLSEGAQNSIGIKNYPHTTQMQTKEAVQFEVFTCKKSIINDIGYIPIYIYLYENSMLKGTVYMSIQDLTVLSTLSDTTVFSNALYTYLTDSEGDQLYIVPTHYNIIDQNEYYTVKEMNDHSYNFYVPLISKLDVFQIRSKDLYALTYFSTSQKQVQFYNTQNNGGSFSIQLNNVQVTQYPNNQKFVKNTVQRCKINTEHKAYFTRQNTKLIIRIFFDDYCKFKDLTIYPNPITITPTLSSAFATIVEAVPLQISSQRVIIFTLNIDPSSLVNFEHKITYSLPIDQLIKIETTSVWIASPSNDKILFSNLEIGVESNLAVISLDCSKNQIIYYEVDLYERQDKLLSSTDLKALLQDNQIRQAEKTSKADKQSTHYIGSFLCNPLNSGNIRNSYRIKNLRSDTKYSINLISDDDSIIKQFSTSTNTIALLFLQSLIYLDPSISNSKPSEQQYQVISQFLCYLSNVFAIPYQFIRFSGFPSLTCQTFVDADNGEFTYASSSPPVTSDYVCNLLNKDNMYSSDRDEEDEADISYYRFSPLEYKNDTNIFIEIDHSQASQDTFLQSLKNQQGFDIESLNYYTTNTIINICDKNNYIYPVKNYGNTVTPQIEISKNTCRKSLICSIYVDQVEGSSIIYFGLLENKLSLDQQSQLTVASFRENTQGFLLRYVYPLDKETQAQFNITIPEADTIYYAYFFMTDLTVQDHVYQFPEIKVEEVEFITTYESQNLILYIVIPIASVVVIIGVFYGVQYIRNRKKVGVQKINEVESSDEEKVQIKDIENNNKLDNILDDLNSVQALSHNKSPLFNKEYKDVKCQQIVSSQGKVDLRPQNKVINTKLIAQHYDGDLKDVDDVVLL